MVVEDVIDYGLFVLILEIVLIGLVHTAVSYFMRGTRHDTSLNRFTVTQAACLSSVLAAYHYGGATWLVFSFFSMSAVLMWLESRYFKFKESTDGSQIFFSLCMFNYSGVALAISMLLFFSHWEMILALAMAVFSGVLITLGSVYIDLVDFRQLRSVWHDTIRRYNS